MEADAIISVIEIAWKIGERVVNACQDWRHADEEIDERINSVELCWQRIDQQINTINQISPLLSPEHCRILTSSVTFTNRKLDTAIGNLQSLTKDAKDDGTKREGTLSFGKKVKKSKYAIVKEGLDEVIKEMWEWQKHLEPNFYLLTTLAGPLIEEKLKALRREEAEQADHKTIHASTSTSTSTKTRSALISQKSPLSLSADIRGAVHGTASPKSVMLTYDTSMVRTPILYSPACLAKRSERTFIIDPLSRTATTTDFAAFTSDVRQLVKKLSKADPFTLGMLNCKGAMPVKDESNTAKAYELILRTPEGLTNPKSLRQILIDAPSSSSLLSLSRRLAIAQQLARSIVYVHTFNFVHKNITPESILLMEGDALSPYFTFLVGFGNFRGVREPTAMVGDKAWERNLYRHPERQGEQPQDTYRMQHDVYSLGVCLLEIGLWESLLAYKQVDGEMVPQKGVTYKNFLVWAKETETEDTLLSFQLKDYLVHLAETRLPQSMGDIFKDVVVQCLTCLDVEEDDDSAVDLTTDKADVGVQFVEAILGSLSEIRL